MTEVYPTEPIIIKNDVPQKELPDTWKIVEEDGKKYLICQACDEKAVMFFMNYYVPCCVEHYKKLHGVMDIPEGAEYKKHDHH